MTENKITKNQCITIILILFFALILRLYLSQFGGYELDVNWFKNWSQEVYSNGFSNFYQNTNSDYPPFYIYILWVIGAINSLTSTNINPLILFKLPSFFADIATSLLIFIIVIKYTSYKTALISVIFYAFNPAIIYNSSIWGQVDSIYTFLLLFAIYEFISEKPTNSAIFFALSILTKPQSLVLFPLFLILGFKKYKLNVLIRSSIISFVVFILFALPFYVNTSILELYRLYTSSYIQYPFTSLNAFNFWALVGMFKPDNTIFLFLTYRIWGYILFSIFFIYITYFTIKNNNNTILYYSSVLLFLGFFMLFTRIHERYMFPIFSFLSIVIIFDRRLYYVYILSTITFLANLYLVFEEIKMGYAIPFSMFIISYSIIMNIVIFIYLNYCFITYNIEESKI